MKKRKILLGLALAAAAVFSLSACGDDAEPTTPTVDNGGSGEQGGGGTVTPAKKNFTVNFYSNGGTAVASQTIEEGKKATKPTNPTRTGSVNTYNFEGWYTDVALTQAFSFDTAISGDVTLYAKWTSTTVTATAITMNGTEYTSIAAALAAVPTDSTDTYTIIIPKGNYNENGLAYNGKATIKLVGATDTKYGADVVITGHGSDMTQEKTRNLVSIQGTGNIILENLTLVSDWTRNGAADAGIASNTQAEVLGTDTKGNTIAYNCGFKSHQDTLRTAGKAWFYGCYIEGDVDFIWMEQAGSVALYEKCEIVSVYDSQAGTHASYVTAPRMAISSKAGKGLVIYNSTVKESEEAKTNGQTTFLGRSPWTSGYYSQVAYINTTCSDIEAGAWKGNPIPTEYDRTVVGWKMDKATADTLSGYTGTDVLDAKTVSTEFNGRRTILNRIYNCGKLKYEKDTNVWDIDAVIEANGWAVDMDTSSDTLEGETAGEPTTYLFDGSVDQAAMCDGFALQSGKTHYVGQNGATITVPVSGKCYVEVYGYYAGTAEVKAGNQGEAVMFFNNGSTSAEVINTYAVYDTATSVTITAKATTYITKVVVTPDTGIQNKAVESITVAASSKLECVGVAQKLTATVAPGNATNKSVKWSSSDTDVADIDTYTGKVTFKKEGTVTFTATACDGSGKTGSIECHPVNPTWTECEWFTTDSNLGEQNAVVEEGVEKSPAAAGIDNFSFGSSTAYKSMGSNFTWTNLAGKSFTTANGLKLDSKGELIVATTKSNAYLTVVVAHIGKIKATPSVKAGSVEAKLVSETDSSDKKTTTYVYYLASAGTWSITRGNGDSENDPILYASCAYETRLTTNTFVNYKGGSYSATGTGATTYNHNNDASGSRIDSTAQVTIDNITYNGAKSNGNSNDNWLVFNTGNTISFKVAGACQLLIYSYQGANALTVTLDGTAVPTTTAAQTSQSVPYVYELSDEGVVVITATGNGYLGAFEIVYPSNAVTEDIGLVFHGDTISGMTNVVKWSNNQQAGTEGKFTVSGSNLSNPGYLEFKNDDKIEFELDFDTTQYVAKITISSYADAASTVTVAGTALTVAKDETNSSNQNYIYEAIAESNGVVTISATTTQNYLNYITITLVDKNA